MTEDKTRIIAGMDIQEDVLKLRIENEQLKKQFEKVEYTLKKIIETVHNDRIDYYGERLVLIYDYANECLQEIEK